MNYTTNKKLAQLGKTKVLVVLVSWQNHRFIDDCLQSLQNQTFTNFDIAWVDNYSNDGSLGYVKQKWLHKFIGKVIFFSLPFNTGFAHGNNVAFKFALRKG